MKLPRSQTLLRIASIFALAALGLMTWGILGGGVLPIMVSMSVGQALGTTSFATFLFVIARDFRRSRILDVAGDGEEDEEDAASGSDPKPEP